ncbi:MAG: hypothetical protein JW795_22185 [Chitinivibrionales bacterium]|nr:hypothetical protein [Chitinivibrionales bacterium]
MKSYMHSDSSFTIRFIFFTALIFIFIALSCTTSTNVPETAPMEVLVPKANDTLNAEDHGFVIARYDPIRVDAIMWSYSKDNKKTWLPMTTLANHDREITQRPGDPYLYSTWRWWPELDTLADITIYIKISSYGGRMTAIHGPIVIH